MHEYKLFYFPYLGHLFFILNFNHNIKFIIYYSPHLRYFLLFYDYFIFLFYDRLINLKLNTIFLIFLINLRFYLFGGVYSYGLVNISQNKNTI